MKDLIVITAHCPDKLRRKILLDLVVSMQPARVDFDLMVISHTPITFDVQERVDWAIYDQDNELLQEWQYQNQPWFSPLPGMTIQSVFFGKGNTYLPVHKQLITGYSTAKTFGYQKAHFIEYDALYPDHTEFYDNSRLLEEHDAVLYIKPNGWGEINIDWGLGHFHSAKISSLDHRAFSYDRFKMMEEIANSEIRTTEKRTQDIYTANGNSVIFKDHNLLTQNRNQVRLVNVHQGEMEMEWAVPFYDPREDVVKFIVWNEASEEPATVHVITNDQDLLVFEKTPKFSWSIRTLGKLENINSITILINHKVKKHISLSPDNWELFKQTNFVRYQ